MYISTPKYIYIFVNNRVIHFKEKIIILQKNKSFLYNIYTFTRVIYFMKYWYKVIRFVMRVIIHII